MLARFLSRVCPHGRNTRHCELDHVGLITAALAGWRVEVVITPTLATCPRRGTLPATVKLGCECQRVGKLGCGGGECSLKFERL
jgi:hypothetical protein